MPDLNDFHAFKSTSGGSGGTGSSGGGGIGCAAWIVIGIVVFMLISFLADGASWEAIETLLAFGLIAFLLARWLFRQSLQDTKIIPLQSKKRPTIQLRTVGLNYFTVKCPNTQSDRAHPHQRKSSSKCSRGDSSIFSRRYSSQNHG